MSSLEKKIVILLLLIFLVSSGFYVKNRTLTQEIPNFGGTYIEGTLSNSESELSQTINNLTKVGLTTFDNEGKIVPDLAESWQISSDGLSYVFFLRSFAKSDEILDIIKSEKEEWSDISISKVDDNKIKFDLKQPLGPFLARTTDPLFPYGPYKIAKTSKTEITFESNKDYWQHTPYIDRIILKLYPDSLSLEEALKTNKIMGAINSNADLNLKDYQKIQFSLPKYKMVFFNTVSESFQDKEVRKKLVRGENLGKELNVRMAVLDNQKELEQAGNLVESWGNLGLKIIVEPYDALTMQKQIIPKKDYDMILYGVNYGAEEDLYPFFHSSQIKTDGLNFSNFSNHEADKILEDARLTTDPNDRNKKYQDFKKILDEEAPAYKVNQENVSYFINNKVKGVEKIAHSVTVGGRFGNVVNWYIKTKKVK